MMVHVVLLALHAWIDAIAAAMIIVEVSDTKGSQGFYYSFLTR